MRLFVRLATLAVMALMLMAQSCGDDGSYPSTSNPPRYGGSSGSYGGSSSYGGGTYQPRFVAPHWQLASVHPPANRGPTCQRNYVRSSLNGSPICASCPPGLPLQMHDNHLMCPSCPPGFGYHLHDGRGVCRG